MEPDRGLTGSRPTLDDERGFGVARDQRVLGGLDRRDDVAHVRLPTAFELLEQEVATRDGRGRAVECLVGDVQQVPALRPEPPAQRHALRIGGRRGVERSRRRRLPVAHDNVLIVVVHPAAPDIERPVHGLDVEPAEAEAAFGVLERLEPLSAPFLQRERRHFRRRRVNALDQRVAHPVEMLVRVIEIRLLGREIGMHHRRRIAAA
jgi:hypothetical protein